MNHAKPAEGSGYPERGSMSGNYQQHDDLLTLGVHSGPFGRWDGARPLPREGWLERRALAGHDDPGPQQASSKPPA